MGTEFTDCPATCAFPWSFRVHISAIPLGNVIACRRSTTPLTSLPSVQGPQLLQGVGRLDGFPPQPHLFAHDEEMERPFRLKGIHEPEKTGPIVKLRPRDAVVAVDLIGVDRPPLPRRVVGGAVDLAGDRLLPVSHAGQRGALARWVVGSKVRLSSVV